MAIKLLNINSLTWLRTAVTLAMINMSALSFASCKGMVMHAHRGEYSQPENSVRAIQSALNGTWDGVEIDLQQLRDHQLIIHHDQTLGRTTSLAKRSASDIDSATWREIRLKDRNGKITNESAPFLADTLASVQNVADKVVNAEIKQLFSSCEVAQQAVKVMNEGRPSGQWFLTSIDRRHLQCARRADSNGYLGVIVLDQKALALQNKRTARFASRLPAPTISSAWLRSLQQDITAPVGIHVDINTLKANPNLLTDARALDIPVFTYHLGSDAEHAQVLRLTGQRTGLWPSGAIIDGTAETFCDKLSR